MFKPKSFVCKWCGKHHYKGSKVARYHAKMLKKYATLKPKKVNWEKTFYDFPYKIKYGYWKWKKRFFIEFSRKKNGKYHAVKRVYYKTSSSLMRKVNKVKRSGVKLKYLHDVFM